MRVSTPERLGRWTRGLGLAACLVLAWAAFVPDGLFWGAVLVASLIGSAAVTAVLVRSRGIPSLAEVIASAESEAVAVPADRGYTSGAGDRPRPRGEGKP